MALLQDRNRLRGIEILGCRVDDVTLAEAVDACEKFVQRREPAMVVTPNAEIVDAAQRDDQLRRMINQSALSIPDGAGLLLAARVLGTPLREQVTGTDLCVALAGRAAERGFRLFLVGARPGVAEAAAERLRTRTPGLQVVGTFAGEASEAGDEAARSAIRAVEPVDIVYVAYGARRQERWIERNQEVLGVPLALGIGGALDFISGRVVRAPVWVRRAGFDWLFRLVRQPWRWRRQLALPRFLWAVLASAGWTRFVRYRARAQRKPTRRHD